MTITGYILFDIKMKNRFSTKIIGFFFNYLNFFKNNYNIDYAFNRYEVLGQLHDFQKYIYHC